MRRWLRWIIGGLVSSATPLPWLVDVTSQRFSTLERRVERLEAERCLISATTVLASHATVQYLAGPMTYTT